MEEAASADYLELRAAGSPVLPLWNRSGEPMRACPCRPQADLLVATGRGNAPPGGTELEAFLRAIRPMAPAALIEHPGGGDWESFLAAVRRIFRLVRVNETGPGRRVCLIERAETDLLA